MTKKQTARTVGSSARGGGGKERATYNDSITLTAAQPSADPTPVYAANGKRIGEIRGRTFYKRVKSAHFLTRPPALANDLTVLAQLKAANVERLEVTNVETSATYVATWDVWERHSFPVDRSGYGPQRALALGWWSVNGQPPALAPREPDPNAPRQLALFGEGVP